MALTLSYIELKRMRLAVEKQIGYYEIRIQRARKVLDGESTYGGVADRKISEVRLLETMNENEEKRENFVNLLTKLQEEIRKLEGVEARTSSFRNIK